MTIPYGDPAAMRAFANALIVEATRLDAASEGVYRSARAIQFEGPAASRFVESAETNKSRGRSATERLHAAARLLLAAAARLEAEQHAARLAEERRAAEREGKAP